MNWKAHNRKMTPELLQRMEALKLQGARNCEIAQMVGLHERTVGKWLNGDVRFDNGGVIGNRDPIPVELKRQALELYRQVPRDTRDLTARLCGDPLPGRSALDQRAGA